VDCGALRLGASWLRGRQTLTGCSEQPSEGGNEIGMIDVQESR
jgi:hypothetical protein